MAVPSPDELIERFGEEAPEALAARLGFQVTRSHTPPGLPGVRVMSEYRPERTIILYQESLHRAAEERGQSFDRVEQWHIAHELYHGLVEAESHSAWRVRETEADMWADELVILMPTEQIAGDGAD
jgi:hypothetical protein